MQVKFVAEETQHFIDLFIYSRLQMREARLIQS